METYIINTIDEFFNYFKLLKESARIGSVPESYLVGFDTEFIDSSNFPNDYNRRKNWVANVDIKIVPCIIQLATKDICLVINIVNLGNPLPKKIKHMISNESWIKVGVGVENDLKYLSDAFNLGHCGGGIEIKNLGLLALAQNNSLTNMYNTIVGSNIKKDSSICNWTQRLSDDELLYAARDAVISYQLFDSIMRPAIDNISNINTKIRDRLEIKFINYTENTIKPVVSANGQQNYIGLLNEYAMKNGIKKPTYNVTTMNTKPVSFKVTCSFSNTETVGIDKNKKKAKHIAAQNMSQNINI